jgi:hypothetical protein
MTYLQKIFPTTSAIYAKPVFGEASPRWKTTSAKVARFPVLKSLFTKTVNTQVADGTKVEGRKFNPINFLMKGIMPITVLIDLIYFIYKNTMGLFIGQAESKSTTTTSAATPKPAVVKPATLVTAKKV